MPNLRDIIDQRTISAGSPIANHVSKHIQDPVGATKNAFDKLTKSKLEYDQAREETQRNLAPVQSVINHVSQMHNLNPNQDMNMPGQGGILQDPNGMQDPNDPNADPNDPNADSTKNPNNMMQDEDGTPMNMNQTVGKMNQSRPSLVGNQPGVAPGPGQSVRPPKKGVPTPGRNAAQTASNPQNNQYNKQASPPKGNRSLPGAKGPGDPKNTKKNQKAQDGTLGRQVTISVKGSSMPGVQPRGSYSNLEASMGLGQLKVGSVQSLAIQAGGPGSGRRSTFNYSRRDRSDVSQALRDNGFTRGKMKDSGFGHMAETNTSWSHPDGHTAVQTHGSNTNSLQVTSAAANDSIHGDIERSLQNRDVTMKAMSMPMRGIPGGAKASPGGGTTGMTVRPVSGGPPRTNRLFSKRVKAGPEALSDKATAPGDEVAYNPVIRSKSAGKPKGSGNKPHRPGIANDGGVNRRLPQPQGLAAGGPGSGRKPYGKSPKAYMRERQKQQESYRTTGTRYSPKLTEEESYKQSGWRYPKTSI